MVSFQIIAAVQKISKPHVCKAVSQKGRQDYYIQQAETSHTFNAIPL